MSKSCGKYYAKNYGILSNRVIMEKRNLYKTGDSLMTARAVVAIEINVPKFGTSKSTVLTFQKY